MLGLVITNNRRKQIMNKYYYLVQAGNDTIQLKIPDDLVKELEDQKLLPLQGKPVEFLVCSDECLGN